MNDEAGTLAASVVLPTYARPAKLSACLEGLARLKLDAPFEVVVVDDGSPEPVAPVVEAFSDRLTVRCLRQANAGPARARNHGAAAARGRWLAFTDDDCEPEPGWLLALVRALEAQPDALVGGATVNAVGDNIYADTAQDLVSFLYEHAKVKAADGEGFDFFTSNNMACAKASFTALGGFDETFPLAAGEDRDFGLRFKASGGPLLFEPKAVMRHHHDMSLSRFVRQQRNYGRGAFHLRARASEKGGGKVPFEGVRFYSGMLSYPFRHRSPKPLARAVLLGLSQAAMVAGFAQEAVQRRGGGGGVV
nr:glycosyltransferase [Parvularcula dongshanensis]